MLGNYITPVPAQQRLGPRWYTGSADAILQSLNLVYDENPDYIVVFGADHVYRMDPRQMVEAHIDSGAGVTVAGIRVPREEARAFGVIETDPDGSAIAQFLEKPAQPPGTPDDPEVAYASMGNYVFTADVLIDALRSDADDPGSAHDLGGNIIPLLVEKGQAAVYDFSSNQVPGATNRDRAYWRDVGTLDSYFEAHMDLVSVNPIFNLYNQDWPILTHVPPRPPAKFVLGGRAYESLVCSGSIVTGTVARSVLSPDVFVEDGAWVENSVLMSGVRIGRGAVVRNVILDKNVCVPDGERIGVDLDQDREHHRVTDSGIVVLGKNEPVHAR